MNREGYQNMTYKVRVENLKRLCRDTNMSTSPLLIDYTCAILAGSPKILQQGRMYITFDFICFYCRLLRYEQKIFINFNEIGCLTKEKTALVFPNAIQIIARNGERYFFASFTMRDRTFHVINKVWSENKSGLKLSTAAIWDRVRSNYGNDLGFTAADPEYEDSKTTQFTARYTRRPSNLHDDSSLDESNYESFDDSISSNSRENLSSSLNGNHLNNKTFKRKHKSADENEIKFDLLFSKNPKEDLPINISPSEDVIHPNIEMPLEAASCSGHEHFPTVTLDEEFNINVTTLWTYLFTDNAFFRAFSAMRMIVDIKQSTWSNEGDTNDGVCRTIYYTVNLKNKIGPKQSPTIEKQVRLSGSKENYIYIIESTIKNMGIPMSDSFHIVILYCLLYISPTRSRLKISMKVVYTKGVFFATKSIIDSTVKSNCLEYTKDLKSSLINESKQISVNKSDVKVYQLYKSIEESYSDPATEYYIENPILNNGIRIVDENKISWMTMVLICCIAFFLLYIVKEIFSNHAKPSILPINKQHSHDPSSIKEIMKLIQEMKVAIELLKKNIEVLNQSSSCLMPANSN